MINSLPNKISCFIWLDVRCKILTWENLQRKGKQGPSICIMCKEDNETVEHLFINCTVWKLVAEHVCLHFNLHGFISQHSLVDMLLDWLGKISKISSYYQLPFYMMWTLWKVRNKMIFEDEKRNIFSIVYQVISAVQHLSTLPVKKKKSGRVLGNSPPLIFPCGFIDGASKCMDAGAGFCIYISKYHHLEFMMGVGQGTNTKAELLSLWAILLISQMMGIPLSQIYGDSLVIINWVKGSAALSPTNLVHWCRETKKLFSSFKDLSITHIYREHNRLADRLSKDALSFSQGRGIYKEYFEDQLVSQDIFQLF